MEQSTSELKNEQAGIASQLEKLAIALEQSEVKEYVKLFKKPRRYMFMQFLAGIVRGMGIAIGFTVFMVTLLYALRALGALNIPYVGHYIADVVKIVQHQLDVSRTGY
jgi:predicted PurR-regulated permease PerM